MLFPLAALHQAPHLPDADRIMAMADHVFGPSPTTSPRERSQTILRAIKNNMASFLATIDPSRFPDAKCKRSLANANASAGADDAGASALSTSSSIDNTFAQPYPHTQPSPYRYLHRHSSDRQDLLMHHHQSSTHIPDGIPSTHGMPTPVSAAALAAATTIEEHHQLFYATTTNTTNGNMNGTNYFSLSPANALHDGVAAADTWWKWPPQLDQDDLFRELNIF